MSFITKRERVFNDYNLLDLPARNEGKLKAYASCTDARAWSHFCADKSDHLVEIIKRNNETCRPKYVPTDVIVNTLMGVKNAEIARLRRKIEEFEQLLLAYDRLDLTCDQKVEIANAHAAIKAANKELDDMCLDLDLSGYTEGIDSEAFETGKSRGDEISRHKDYELETSRGTEWSFDKLSQSNKETKSNQIGGLSCPCDASTVAVDPRIDEMQEVIICKDAKLNAMRNTIAVMENDICEPYCIYAHIYTALEKIYGILCQNEKYKNYLELLTSGKDTRNVDIKGKIFYKLKVFEKFCCALIAPCSKDCSCYHAEVISRVETAFALNIEESVNINNDTKRAHLVADIMGNEEMKELLGKKSSCDKFEEFTEETEFQQNSSIDVENINRLKDLQASYDDLLTCYDDLKFEKHCLTIKCRKYEELEKEFENLRNQLSSYNSLWNEKEYYKKRSENLDLLKEKYLVLADETLNLETQLRAQEEINNVKSVTVEQLRNDNLTLEKRLNEVSVVCGKEKHSLICKLKECECKILCQDEQINSLSLQINKFLEQNDENIFDENRMDSSLLFDQIESQKEEINNLKNTLFYKNEEKQQLQDGYEEKLVIISNLRLEIEEWKRACEQETQRNYTLEKLTRETQGELKKITEENKNLVQENESKQIAIENLMNVLGNKSVEINKLTSDIELQINQNKQLQEINELYNNKIKTLENERKQALNSLQLASQESYLLLGNYSNTDVFNYEQNLICDKNNSDKITEHFKTFSEEERVIKQSENQNLSNSLFLNEIESFCSNNKDNIRKILSESNASVKYLDTEDNINEITEIKPQDVNELKEKLKTTEELYNNILLENKRITKELEERTNKIDEMNREIQEIKQDKQRCLDQLSDVEKLKEYSFELKCEKEILIEKKNNLENDVLLKNEEIKKLSNLLKILKIDKQHFNIICSRIETLEKKTSGLNEAYDNLIFEKNDMLQKINFHKSQYKSFVDNLMTKTNENNKLSNDLETLQEKYLLAQNKIKSLENEKRKKLDTEISENNSLKEKLEYYSILENELDAIKESYHQLKKEKENLEVDFKLHLNQLLNIEAKNQELQEENKHLAEYNKNIENALIDARHEFQLQLSLPSNSYMDLKKEVEEMKKENDFNLKRIENMSAKIYESDEVIANLTQDISERDVKISILENHVNELGNEVKRLQTSLSSMIDLGEEMNLSSQEIDNSLKRMEAHHSKATHNMKIEMAKLKNENNKLEKQLSATNVETEALMKRQDSLTSQKILLQDERDKIVTYIHQLEMRCVGTSSLLPNNCGIKSILMSLEEIDNYIKARNNSCQLILSKADEAKKIIEKEKQKIIKEKDDAIKDKMEVQKELGVVKEALEKQKTKDIGIIKDLEAELLNQKLLIDKIKQSTQNYISKLEEELSSIQKLYQNSLNNINEIESKLKISDERCSQNNKTIEKAKIQLEEKCKEIKSLENIILSLKTKDVADFTIQTNIQNIFTSTSIQTENIGLNEIVHKFSDVTGTKTEVVDKDSRVLLNTSFVDYHESKSYEKQSDLLNMQSPKFNEIQILTANIEPSLAVVKNAYLRYKIKRLSLRQTEQYSFSVISKEMTSNSEVLIVSERLSSDVPPDPRESYKVIVTKKKSLDSFSDSLYLSENNKSLVFSGSIAFNNEIKDIFYTSSNNNVSKSLTDINTIAGYDTIIYRSGNTDNESRTTSRLVNTAEKLKNAKMLRRKRSNVKENSLTKVRTIDSLSPNSYEGLERKGQEAIPTSSKYDNMNLSNLADDSLQHSISEASILKNRSYKDTKIEHNQVKNGVNKKNIRNLTNDTKSLVFPTKFKQDGDNDDLSYLRIISNIDQMDNVKNESPVVDSKVYNVSPVSTMQRNIFEDNNIKQTPHNYRQEKEPNFTNYKNTLENIEIFNTEILTSKRPNASNIFFNNSINNTASGNLTKNSKPFGKNDFGVTVQIDNIENYKEKIKFLSCAIENLDRDYKEKIRAIKAQYDNNIRHIINEHNQGVQSLQSLHEETLQDILKVHENETENLRSMSIEAMRRVDKLESENKNLKSQILTSNSGLLDVVPTRISSNKIQEYGTKNKTDHEVKTLTKTSVEEFSITPKIRTYSPCTCTLDINISDTIRNIFEQVDVEQRRMAEQAYLKYIVNKIMCSSLEALDVQELSFLHFKVCRTWKTVIRKEEALDKRIDSLETELINKQKQAQKHIAELDRKVAEERRRLQEVREAVCREPSNEPQPSRALATAVFGPSNNERHRVGCGKSDINETLPGGDLATGLSGAELRYRRCTTGRARKTVVLRMDGEEHRDKKQCCDERPTRLRRSNDRPNTRSLKK